MFSRLYATTRPRSLEASSIKAPAKVVNAKDSKIMDKKHAGNAPQASAHKIEQFGSRSYLSDHHSNKNTEDEIMASKIT